MNLISPKAMSMLAIVLAVTFLFGAEKTPSAAGNEQTSADALKQARLDYAQALLKNAQANLAKAEAVNAKFPNSFPNASLSYLQNEVSLAQARVHGLQSAGSDAKQLEDLATANQAVVLAEDALNAANTINAREPGMIEKPELDCLQAALDLARARQTVTQLLGNVPSPEQTQWELTRMQDELRDLRIKVQLLEDRN